MKRLLIVFLKTVLNLFVRSPHPSISSSHLQLRWRLGWIKTQVFYKPLWNLKARLKLGPKIVWGQRAVIQGHAVVFGAGRIEFGDDVIVDNATTLYTHSREAVLRVGARTYLNGTRFGCAVKIEIGADCIIGDARIMDTDFHSLHIHRTSPKAPILSAPVVVEDNVWLAAGTGILKGVHIGKNSVVGFGSVVSKSLLPDRIYAGNPAREVGRVEGT